jgi:hypothetical protein
MRYPYESFYKKMDERNRNIEIRREIQRGLLKDGKVSVIDFHFIFCI